jgi:hypothetical protein
MHSLRKRINFRPLPAQAPGAPPALLEYAFYFSVFYSVLGDTIGISVIPMLGNGLLAIQVVGCFFHRQARTRALWAKAAFPLGCAFSYMLVQTLVHGESFLGGNVRPFLTWAMMIIITQSLSLRRGFLRRFVLATLLIGLASLPFLKMESVGNTVARAALSGTDIGNPNDFGGWFGFCAVYFWISGMVTKNDFSRILSWLTAGGCLGILGLTVSRSALLAVGVAITVSLRHLLKRGFFPVLLLVISAWMVFELGLFEGAISSYTQRGMEETGRFTTWPLAIERILDSPLLGVGTSNVATMVGDRDRTPHNALIYIALSSGIVPFAFFMAYWWHAARGALRANSERTIDAPYLLPLLILAFLVIQGANSLFMRPWVIATLSVAISANVSRRAHQTVAYRSNVFRLRQLRNQLAHTYVQKNRDV